MINKIYRELLKEDLKNNSEEFKSYKKKVLKDLKENLTPKDRVFLSRYEKRPKTSDFIKKLIDGPIYLHGDRKYKDDKAVIGGIGKLNDEVITFIAIDKGKNLKESLKKNFGMASPDGYRKATRLMKEAEKFNRTIVTFIDTPGAYPGIEAEERGQAEAIASAIYEMTALKVPIISVITGEGCSGGALGLSVCDYLIMMENATYSVLSPEGFSSILWKDTKKVDKAIDVMKLTSKDLYDYKICDEIIDEDLALNIFDFKDNFTRLKESIYKKIIDFREVESSELLVNRRRKYEI